MKNKYITDKLIAYIGEQKEIKSLTYKAISEACGVSVDQVRRRVSGEVAEKKESIKNNAQENKNPVRKSQKNNAQSETDKLLITLIAKIDAMDAKINKLVDSEWIAYHGENEPSGDCEVKVKLSNGKIFYGNKSDFDWSTVDNRKYDVLNDAYSYFNDKYVDSDTHEEIAKKMTVKDIEEKGLDVIEREYFDIGLELDSSWSIDNLTDFELQNYGKDYRKARDIFRFHMKNSAFDEIKSRYLNDLENEYLKRNKFAIEQPVITEFQVMKDPNKKIMEKLRVMSNKLGI